MFRWLTLIVLMGISVGNIRAEDVLEGYHPFPFGDVLQDREIAWFELDDLTYLSLIKKPNPVLADFSHFVTVYDSAFHAIHSGSGNLEGLVFRGKLRIENEESIRIVLAAYKNERGVIQFRFISPRGIRPMQLVNETFIQSESAR